MYRLYRPLTDDAGNVHQGACLSQLAALWRCTDGNDCVVYRADLMLRNILSALLLSYKKTDPVDTLSI